MGIQELACSLVVLVEDPFQPRGSSCELDVLLFLRVASCSGSSFLQGEGSSQQHWWKALCCPTFWLESTNSSLNISVCRSDTHQQVERFHLGCLMMELHFFCTGGLQWEKPDLTRNVNAADRFIFLQTFILVLEDNRSLPATLLTQTISASLSDREIAFIPSINYTFSCMRRYRFLYMFFPHLSTNLSIYLSLSQRRRRLNSCGWFSPMRWGR